MHFLHWLFLNSKLLQNVEEKPNDLESNSGTSEDQMMESCEQIATEASLQIPLHEEQSPPKKEPKKHSKPDRGPAELMAYTYSSSSEDESDSLADSLSPHLINEAIGKFQMTYISQRNSRNPIDYNQYEGDNQYVKMLEEDEPKSESSDTIEAQSEYKSNQGYVVKRETRDVNDLQSLVSKLDRSCKVIQRELAATKGDLGNVQSSLGSIQQSAEKVVEKLNKFSIRMYDMERQTSILLKVGVKFAFYALPTSFMPFMFYTPGLIAKKFGHGHEADGG